jgi:hypothetical protein
MQSMAAYGNGHINDTVLLTCVTGQRYVVQRVNARVFPRPGLVMANIEQVCAFLATRSEALAAEGMCALSLVPTRSGASYRVDDHGDYWRCYPFIEDTSVVEQVSAPEQAWQAANGFARFNGHLAAFDASVLHETIADFHHTPKRLQRLQAAVTADSQGRLRHCTDEVAWATDQQDLAGSLLAAHAAGAVPLRVTHNDTKINNVLFTADGARARCVIDLDTLMPGLSLYDIGDLIRTASCRAPEDGDPADMVVDSDCISAIVDGWLSGVGASVTAGERALMIRAGAVITYEVGIRFLTDYLDGDRYFSVKHPEHNLQRARAQLALASNIMAREDDLAVAAGIKE